MTHATSHAADAPQTRRPSGSWDREVMLTWLRAALPEQVRPQDVQQALQEMGAPGGAPAGAPGHAAQPKDAATVPGHGATQLLIDIADELPVGVCVVDADLRALIINRAARQLLDLPDHLFAAGMPHFRDVVRFNAGRGEYGPGDPDELAARIVERARKMQPHRLERTRPDGTVLDIRGEPIAGGGFCTIWADITELQRARAEALAREQELRSMIDCMPGTIGCVDADGRVRMANQRLALVYGRNNPQEVEGLTVRELLGEERYEASRVHTETAMTGEPVSFRRCTTRADGSQDWMQIFLEPRLGPDGRPHGLYKMGVDITALVQTEQELQEHNQRLEALNTRLEAAQSQLMQSEKLASIGQLAAGVAHEINNPVGFVASNMHSLERYVASLMAVATAAQAAEPLLPAGAAQRQALARTMAEADLDYLQEDLPELLAQTHDGLQRVKKIVQDLKDFSHADVGHHWELADLERGLESTLTIAQNEVKYKAEVVREYGGLPPVQCVPSQLNQVFLNMVVNAGHAIETQGRITVRTGHDAAQAQVWVEFEDTGCGMDEATIQRIFEPFFTTKPVGKGTGLGLSLAYGIMQKHNGRIEVFSTPGVGTRFRLWLPETQPADTAAA